ncbi:hypothetical protein ACFOZ1_08450 [Gracilibacillus marinus]|uniref:Uncharacterized protein n=1 Tax=Gracilibacillus marinus TaxID=630535 RepID=A0ABV8VV24_9BACI
MSGWYVTANDIKVWTETNKRRAEELLPLLVKKLIYASSNPDELHFPSEDSITIGGWDGILKVDEGNEFIPSGVSGWEFGTSVNVKSKADGDYSKRTEEPSPVDKKGSSFVFVTSRVWKNKDEWVEEKNKEEEWGNVIGLNAESLQNWLEQCPAVHRWFSQLIGKRSSDTFDIDQAWNMFSKSTGIHLNKEFFLYSRGQEEKELIKLLKEKSNVIKIKSKSKSEAYGFLLSVIQKYPEMSSRCLVINEQTSWDHMASSDQNLILIPNEFDPKGIGYALDKNHSVLMAVDDKSIDNVSININKHSRIERQRAIEKLGFDSEEAVKIYQDTKGFIEPVLRHPLMKPINKIYPEWPKKTSSDVLFAVFFATEWMDNNDSDKEVMELLSGLSYEKFEREIITLSKKHDPPIRKIGAVWQVISKMDLWLLISYRISKPNIERFRIVLEKVLSDIDPSYDLSSEERGFASIKGVEPLYSQKLKHGIADSLSLLSAYGDEYSEQLGGDKPSELVEYWMRQVYKNNNITEFWYSFNTITPLLAESAPNAFLDAVEEASIGNDPVLLGLFNAEGEGIFGGCYHSGLLWGIELISWNKQYTSRASLCLARLTEIDPGGKWSNRPFNSLVEIFLGWLNNTTTTHQERVEILKQVLIPSHPGVSWNLMIKLLVDNTTVSSGIYKPKYREWQNVDNSKITNKDYFNYIGAIVDLILVEVNDDIANRIPDLLDNFGSYNVEQQKRVISYLFEVEINLIDIDSRDKILEKLREILSRHREFPKEDWSWPEPLLDKLEKVYSLYLYNDVIEDNKYLFNDYWPNIIDSVESYRNDYDIKEKLILQKRISSVENVYEKYGVDGILKLSESCLYPGLVGEICWKSTISDLVQQLALDSLEENNNDKFATGYISELARQDNDMAIEIIDKNWSSNKKVHYLLSIPISEKVIQIVDKLDIEEKTLFWNNTKYYRVMGDKLDLACKIANKLFENGRPLTAIHSISHLFRKREFSSKIDSRLIGAILVDIATKPNNEGNLLQNIRYGILEAIKFVQSSGDFAENEIIIIEWFFLKMFRNERIKPINLINKVKNEPSFFTQLVIWVTKRNDNKQDAVEDISEDIKRNRAENAYDLLKAVNIIPGQQNKKDTTVNIHILGEWISKSREELEKAGRAGIGDIYIGNYLSKSPLGDDNIWPHNSVRKIIETIKSKDFEHGMVTGMLNSRGATWRNPYDGGAQEANLAKQYYENANALQLIFPRTANVLRSIARSYEGYAKMEDQDVELS